jgi:hypothetical protein
MNLPGADKLKFCRTVSEDVDLAAWCYLPRIEEAVFSYDS